MCRSMCHTRCFFIYSIYLFLSPQLRLAFVELFRKSSGRQSSGLIRMLFSDRAGIMEARSAADRKARVKKILGYDPYPESSSMPASAEDGATDTVGALSQAAMRMSETVDIADLMHGMRLVMTNQLKRMVLLEWKKVRLRCAAIRFISVCCLYMCICAHE